MEYRSPKTLSNMTVIGLGIMVVTNFLSMILSLLFLVMPDSSLDLGEGDTVSVWLMAAGLVAIPHIVAFIFTVIVFLMWIHRATSNLQALKATTNEYSPGWAVGWWFIPFANLLKPFHVMRELWCESDPDFDPDSGFSLTGPHVAPVFMTVWWILWVVSNIVSNISNRLTFSNESLLVDMFVNGGFILAAILAIVTVRGITQRQEERIKKIGNVLIDNVPPPPVFDASDR